MTSFKLSFVICFLITGCISIPKDIIDFLKDNRVNYLNIISENTTRYCQYNKSLNSIFSRTFDMALIEELEVFNSDFSLLCLDDISSINSNVFQFISKTKVLNALLLIDQDVSPEVIQNVIDNILSVLPLNMHFYLTFEFEANRVWERVVKIQDQAQVRFSNLNEQIVFDFVFYVGGFQ